MKNRKKELSVRRRKLTTLLAAGKTAAAAARELNVNENLVRRDIRALRRDAARRKPWADPAACSAAFIEAAEEALQKVREAQREVEHDTTAYHNLVKLEWTMLVKFIDLTAAAARPGRNFSEQNEGINDEDEDISKLTDQQLLRKAGELGIDVAGFERALTAAAAQNLGEDDEEIADPGDLGEAA